jgi:hypothetical protein
MNPTFDDLIALKRSLESRLHIVEAKDGKEGPKGPQGPKGAEGAKGAQGPKGPQGPKGADGAKGAQGPQGADGAKGTDGAPGISITDVKVDLDGHLTVHLSDGSVLDAGNVASEEAMVTKIISGGGSGGEGGGTGGSALEISDEGSSLTSTATSINFTGSGVTATNSGDAVTVNIQGGGGGGGSVSVEDGGTEVVTAASTFNFVGDGVVASDAGSNQVDVTINAGTDVASLDAADILTGTEVAPMIQTGTGVKVTTRDIQGSPFQRLVGYDGQRVSVASLLINCPDGFSSSDGDLYGVEPLVCKTTTSGSVDKFAGALFNYGVADLSTGTNAAGYAGIKTAMGSFLFAAGTSELTCGFSIAPKQPGTTSQRHTIRCGWMRATGGGTYDQGIYFEQVWNSANWRAVVKGTGAEEAVDTGVVVDGTWGAFDTMPQFKIVYQGSTETAFFYINGTEVADIDTSTHTINSLSDIAVSIEKTEGTTDHSVYVDTMMVDTVLDAQVDYLL